MKFDGSNATQIVSGQGAIHALAASDAGIAYSEDRTISRTRLDGTFLNFITPSFTENVPSWLTFHGEEFFWVNVGHGVSDDVAQGNVSGTARASLGHAEDISALGVCSDAVYWATVTQLIRHDRQQLSSEAIASFALDVACDGRLMYWTQGGAEPAVMMREVDGALRGMHVLPEGSGQIPQLLTVDAEHLFWAQAMSTIQITRLMRMARP